MANPLFFGSPAIYLDYASLVPPLPAALDAMQRAAVHAWGNPHSLHSIGARALYVLDEARTQIADYLGARDFSEVIFTASGRDAIASGLPLAAHLARERPGPFVCSRLEHPALIASIEQAAAAAGRAVHWLAFPAGIPSDADRDALHGASLVALSACNHELGTKFPLDAIAPDAIRFIDATQATPWLALDDYLDARTFLALSGAKLGAPFGIGALRVPPHVFYAARERGTALESESPPWLPAIGLGAACAARKPRRDEYLAQTVAIAESLVSAMREVEPDLVLNGDAAARLGPIINVSFPHIDGKHLVESLSLRGVCISHTAACRSRREDVSPVVRAAYPDDPERAARATRWSVSEQVTADDLRAAIEALKAVLDANRRWRDGRS